MAKTFAGEAAAEVRNLATNLHGVADGFREATSAANGYVALQRENLALTKEKIAVLRTSTRPAGDVLGSVNGPQQGSGVLGSVNGPQQGSGVLGSVNAPQQGSGVISSVNGPTAGSGVLASVNGPAASEIVQTLKSGFARLEKVSGPKESTGPTTGERQITKSINAGFERLERVMRSGSRNDGGASFRANKGI